MLGRQQGSPHTLPIEIPDHRRLVVPATKRRGRRTTNQFSGIPQPSQQDRFGITKKKSQVTRRPVDGHLPTCRPSLCGLSRTGWFCAPAARTRLVAQDSIFTSFPRLSSLILSPSNSPNGLSSPPRHFVFPVISTAHFKIAERT